MFYRLTLFFIFFLALATPSHADTFSWAGHDGAFSDPASWSGPPPAPGGSPSDQLLFTSTSYQPYTATIDAPWTLNTLSFAFNPDNDVTLAAPPGASLQFDGPNPTLASNGLGSITLNTPISTTSDLTFSGTPAYTLSGPLSSSGPNASLLITGGATLIYQNNTPPSGFSQLILGSLPPSTYSNGALDWNYAPPDSTPISLSFGTAPIIANIGTISFNLTPPANASSLSVSLSNPINVRGYLALGGSSLAPLQSATFNFTGPVTLGGILYLATDRAPNFVDTQAQSTTILLSGDITLDQSNANELDLGPDGGFSNRHVIISGNIVDDPDPTHAAHKPLVLNGPIDSSPLSDFTIAGTHNSYSTGTIISFGQVTLAPGSSLGTGPISVQGGTLQLTSPSNLLPGQTVLLQYNNYSTLSLTFDQAPYSFLDPASSGILALDTFFTTPLDLSKIGNGRMALGTTASGTYAADSLRPASDHIYRFGTIAYNANLTLLHSVLADYDGIPSSAQLAGVTLAAPNSYSGGTTITGDVYVSAPGALGTGNLIVGPNPGITYSGRLYLSAPNAYASTAAVDVFGTLSAIGPNGSIPASAAPPILHPASALILGDNLTHNDDRYPDFMPIHLDNSTLILKGIGLTTESIGPISVSGASTIVLWNPNSGTHTTTLLAPSLSLDDHAVLFLVPFLLPANYEDPDFLPFAPSGSNNANLRLAAPPIVTHGIVPPWIQSRSLFYDYTNNINAGGPPPSFLTYTPNGFALPAYSPMPTNGGTGAEVVDVTAAENNAYLPITNTTLQTIPPSQPSPALLALLAWLAPQNNAFTLPADTSIYALRTSTNILNPAGTSTTLHITGGGLIAAAEMGDYNRQPIIEPNIDFQDAEAFINVQGVSYVNDTQILTLAGVVTANHGLTKFGTGDLRLANPASQIHGPITILEGTLELASLPEPTSTDPIRISTGASLTFLNSTILSRPVLLGAGADLYNSFSEISVPSDKSLTIAAPITGSNFFINGGTRLRIEVPISNTNSLVLVSPEINLASSISAGSLDLAVGRTGRITGAGTITSPSSLYFDEGAIAPGDHPGDIAAIVFDLPEMDLDDGASFTLDLDSAGHSDRLFFTGTLVIPPADPTGFRLPTSLSLNFLAPPTGQTYTLLSAASISGTFPIVTGLPDGYSLDYTPTSLLLLPTSSVPEPTTLTLLLTLPALLSRRLLRR